jgi:hypothetical protein
MKVLSQTSSLSCAKEELHRAIAFTGKRKSAFTAKRNGDFTTYRKPVFPQTRLHGFTLNRPMHEATQQSENFPLTEATFRRSD